MYRELLYGFCPFSLEQKHCLPAVYIFFFPSPCLHLALGGQLQFFLNPNTAFNLLISFPAPVNR